MMKIKSAEFVLSAANQSQFPPQGLPELALVGRSNVGKSSLINRLLGRRNLARTSGTPGKTRLLNFYLINQAWYWVDLPGYGYARVSKTMRQQWGKLIESYLASRPQLKGIIQLLDLRHPPSAEDQEMFTWLLHQNLPLILVGTKADKLSRGKWGGQRQMIIRELGPQASPVPFIVFSSQTGQGVEEMWELLESLLQN